MLSAPWCRGESVATQACTEHETVTVATHDLSGPEH